ncbi:MULTISPECIES: aminotransferase class I/II-fold pyridoxal phosphate-dependent enzyme [Moorena]|uniref:Glutamate decarboxylase family PLP-dependent protein n=2 Tax=Moorena TaxID=1155738 RepID=F4XJ89_9CYAN|nr:MULTISPECIES: aminotransferase class I/II-fold pyridoxal phosphate-dependent enzyme [Moorena]EGJ35169.1 glutamate decarboxylase family PLP-dependent protein [Moorena producens 3L]NEP30104.1 aminotransferase class I/II-fold pyridoxal phosphate-dependent enzyme [Moorena sp. SIO3B2]NEP65057.1 aminotransferase class I/II-fold pyridoxal phosphate-dependent enzyme [Moorena sp. SIO3A5]NEQ06727.1 aminotransferase class I/II-fold pyridoxal phosphate-dependent enzyme [Moorena sp. SIO4E2]NER91361.1 am
MLTEQDIDQCLKMLDGIYSLSEPERLERIDKFVKSTLSITPDIYSPKNLKYLFSYPDPIGVFADFVSNYINSNIHTEECSPIFTRCEVEMVETLLPLVGYPEGDGIFYPGGTLSNLASVFLAVQRAKVNLGQSVILVSEHSHYSISKAAKICGIQHIINVKTSTKGVVDREHLRELVSKIKADNLNLIYFACVLGSTTLGTFDPVEEILEIFQEFAIQPWIHLDAAWGGGVYFSEDAAFSRKLSSLSDSIVLDFHKFLSAPLLCSVLLVKDKSVLVDEVIAHNPNSPFNSNQNRKYSLSIKSLQCSREAYAFKLWLMFKHHGLEHFQNLIQKYYKNRKEFRKQLSDRVLYVVEPQYFNLCFWFIPEEMEVKETITDYTAAEIDKIDQLNLAIYDQVVQDDFIKVSSSSFNNLPAFIRIIVHHGNLTTDIISEIVAYLYKIYESFG